MDLLIELWLKIIEDADYHTAINLSSICCTIYTLSDKIRQNHFKKRFEIICDTDVTFNTTILGIYTHLSKDELLGSHIYVYANFWSGSRKIYCTQILLTETNVISCGNMRKIIINENCCFLRIRIKDQCYIIDIKIDNDKTKGKLLGYNLCSNAYNTFYTDNFVAYGDKIIIRKVIK